MNLSCPTCSSITIKKNGHIHNGKQNHQCLSCGRQFVLNPEKKVIPEEEKAKIQQALLERVSLEGICRIFAVSMPWLLKFMDEIIHELPENLNADVIQDEEFEVATLELDEQWSYVGNNTN
jgi:transposase-like protein